MPKKAHLELRIIIYRDPDTSDRWIGHCLELDLVAQGDSPQSALDETIETCAFQIQCALEDNDLKSIINPAPKKFWVMYEEASEPRSTNRLKGMISKNHVLEEYVQRLQYRELTPAC